jgi:5-methylcytosine-specific restriction endonuclease McrA
MRKKSKKIDDAILRQVFERQDGRCANCYSVQLDTYPHHRKYRGRTGSDDPNNLVWLCRKCHNKAHAGDPEMDEFRTPAEAPEGVTERQWNECNAVCDSRDSGSPEEQQGDHLGEGSCDTDDEQTSTQENEGGNT